MFVWKLLHHHYIVTFYILIDVVHLCLQFSNNTVALLSKLGVNYFACKSVKKMNFYVIISVNLHALLYLHVYKKTHKILTQQNKQKTDHAAGLQSISLRYIVIFTTALLMHDILLHGK